VKVRFHPSKPEVGFRRIKVEVKDDSASLFICPEDAKILKDKGMVRLMELFNVKLVKFSENLVEAMFHSETYEEARSLNMPLIHWLPVDQCIKAKVIMPDATELEGFVEQNCVTIELGEVVQFERFGFVRLDSKDDCWIFYYAHK